MKMTMTAALAAGVTMLLAGTAQAQDPTQNAISGNYSLSSGFTPDPYSISVTAGGSIDVSKLGGSCSGHVSNAPDVQLNYTAGSLPLHIYVNSSADTTLIVNSPDSQWYCDDDSNGNLDPRVTFNNPRSGIYDIWIGTFSGGMQSSTLNITELNSNVNGNGGSGSSGSINTGLTATFGDISLNSGFTPDPYRISLTAGGSIQASTISSECRGSVAAAPDVQLTYSAGSLPLIIRTEAGSDTTLLVNGPGGEWYCDDDSGGGTNAQVRLNKPASGVYDIYVGTYSGGNQSANLLITELGN